MIKTCSNLVITTSKERALKKKKAFIKIFELIDHKRKILEINVINKKREDKNLFEV